MAPREFCRSDYVERAHLMNWVAIDDHGEFWAEEHAENLILTDSSQGISSPHALALQQARLAGVGPRPGLSQ